MPYAHTLTDINFLAGASGAIGARIRGCALRCVPLPGLGDSARLVRRSRLPQPHHRMATLSGPPARPRPCTVYSIVYLACHHFILSTKSN